MEYVPIKSRKSRRIVALLIQSDTNVLAMDQALDNVTEHIVAEVTPSRTHSDITVRKIQVKTSKSGSITSKRTCERQSDNNLLDTNIVQRHGEVTLSFTQGSITLCKAGPSKISESRSKVAKETLNRLSDDNVTSTNIVKMDESRPYTAIEKKSLRKLILSNNSAENVLIKTSEPGCIVAKERPLLTRSGLDVTTLSHTLDNVTECNASQSNTAVSKDSLIIMSESSAIETLNRYTNENLLDKSIIQIHRATFSPFQSYVIHNEVLSKKREFESNTATETSNSLSNDNVLNTNTINMYKWLKKVVLENNSGINLSIIKNEPRNIVTKEIFIVESGPDVTILRHALENVTELTASHTQSDTAVNKEGSIINSDSESITTTEISINNVSNTNIIQILEATISPSQSSVIVPEAVPSKKSEPGSSK